MAKNKGKKIKAIRKTVSYGREWTKKEITFLESKYVRGYTRTEISKLYKERFKKEGWERSTDSIKNAIYAYCGHIVKDVPKLLFLDIETAPANAFVWQQYDNNIDLSMLINDGSIISFSAKWAGDSEDKVIYFDQRGKEQNLDNDKELMKKLWLLLDQADIVCGHNIKRFDIPKINSRFVYHELSPPSEYKLIDTLTIARGTFKFFSNKLAHLSEKLADKYKKDSHKDFPGFMLWLECMKGNEKAWNSMKKYNILDTLALEEVFLKLSKYTKNSKIITSALRNYERD